MATDGKHSRRAFLQTAAGFGALGAGGGLAMQLAAMAAASSARAATDDYKAIVCIYLGGGVDNFHTLVPTDSASVAELQKARADLLLPAASLLPISTGSSSGRTAALHPMLVNIQALYNAGRIGIVPNVGPLEERVTREQLANFSKRAPMGAFSHNDGTSVWHTLGLEGARYGWGGRMMDLLTGGKNVAFTSISTGLYNPFGSGQTTEQFRIYPDGIVENFAGARANQTAFLGAPGGSAAVQRIQTENVSHNLLMKQYVALSKRTFEGVTQIQAALDEVRNDLPIVPRPRPDDGSLSYKYNPLITQTRVVARMLKQRGKLGVTRQIFYLDLGGFDLHGGLKLGMNGLLSQFDAAMGYLDDALGQLGMRDRVLVFTTSEFGRTMASNGDGTDHGWGGVQFFMGGGIAGGKLYGELPILSANSPNLTAVSPSLIPDYAIEQSAAAIGKWFGVSETDLTTVLPNRGRFGAPIQLT
jgi:uncharacterized protein (DUF1501 family)